MKPTVLIVDDDENILFAFETILRDLGCDVRTAKDFYEAVKCIFMKEPDIVITDIILGGHTGIDLLSQIKESGLNCPVVMMTGEPNLETSREAVRLGAYDYIAKPIRSDVLERITRHALKQKELMDSKAALEKENLRVRKNMEAIFSSLEDGIISVDSDLNIIEANYAVESICGFSLAQIRNKKFDSQMTGCNGACLEVLKNTLETKKRAGEVQVECKRYGGPMQVISVKATPLRYEGSDFSGAILVLKNVTKLANLEKKLKERNSFGRIIGKSRLMKDVYSLVENLCDTDTTVLITGDSGTGKELIANAIHMNSQRKDMPFVKVNCSALSENLLESELFGHVKGAFTGALRDKTGRFEAADKGIIFLDEIGDISPVIQLKLLRVIQEKEFERVGESKTIPCDVRIIAATNKDLKKKVKLGEFREDLYYRVKVVEIKLPALRERRDDIPLLADHFLKVFAKKFGKNIKNFSQEVMTAFMNYSWPGNVRELEHCIEHGSVLCQGDTVFLSHLPLEIKDSESLKKESLSIKGSVSREEILEALGKTGWNKSRAARMLGISRRTIYRRIDEFRIEKTV